MNENESQDTHLGIRSERGSFPHRIGVSQHDSDNSASEIDDVVLERRDAQKLSNDSRRGYQIINSLKEARNIERAVSDFAWLDESMRVSTRS